MASLSNCTLVSTSRGEKVNGTPRTEDCIRKFTCDGNYGGTVTVECQGTKTITPWTQQVTDTYSCTVEDENGCTFTFSYPNTWTDSGDDSDTAVCALPGGGRSCCPDNSVPTAPFYPSSGPETVPTPQQ